MMKRKEAGARLTQNKALRRRIITWLRMFRYGANNFTRNAWLTTAATAVMTITLLIIFSTYVVRSVIIDTVGTLRARVDISIYLKDDVTDREVDLLRSMLFEDENVSTVRFISVDEAREAYIKTLGDDPDQLQALAELPKNPFPPSLRVAVKNPDDLSSIEKLVQEDDFKQRLSEDPRRQPTFAGERKDVIDTIGKWATTAEQAGIVLSIIFVAISTLIIFNTIRMAIFNRKEEIQMMKLIGADKSFIRGPFVVEAVMYGFIAALLATSLGFLGLHSAEAPLVGYGIESISAVRQTLIGFAPVVLLVMMTIGAAIGIVSSRLAVKRYLKL